MSKPLTPSEASLLQVLLEELRAHKEKRTLSMAAYARKRRQCEALRRRFEKYGVEPK